MAFVRDIRRERRSVSDIVGLEVIEMVGVGDGETVVIVSDEGSGLRLSGYVLGFVWGYGAVLGNSVGVEEFEITLVASLGLTSSNLFRIFTILNIFF